MDSVFDIETLAADLADHGLIGTLIRNKVPVSDECYETFLHDLAVLLNQSEAPSINEGLDDAMEALSGPQFSMIQSIVCDLIPRLEVCHRPLLQLVDRLVQAGGTDLAANQPNAALRSWCAVAPSRSAAIYADARDGELLALKHLTFAFEAHDDVDEAIKFANLNRPEGKLAAATALGRMNLGNELGRACETLVVLAEAIDEQLSLNALAAGFAAAERANAKVSNGLEKALEWRLETTSPQAIHLAATLLWKHTKALSPRVLNLCFAAVEAVDPKNNGTIKQFDHAARSLAEIGQLDRMIETAGRICDRTEGTISLSSFNGLMYQLNSAGPETLGRAVVFWLLNGGVHTRKSLATELTDVGRNEPPYSVPADALPAEGGTQLFLCRKAVGWFFPDPLLAIPILLSVLRNGAAEIANDVLDLIFDPLLLSYDGKLRDYLEAEARRDPKLTANLCKLIEQKDAIRKSAAGSEAIVELRPSETQREAVRVLWQDQMEDGLEDTNRKSMLSDLFTKQYILYGRSSLFTVHRGDGDTELVESEMKPFSVSMEFPLLEIFDPARLRHALVKMKLEIRSEA